MLAVTLLFCGFALPTSAASTQITNSIDLPIINNDTFGSGYSWDNLNCILTLNGINLSTADSFGIKLPAGSTVRLNGKNTIKASAYGIQCLGAVTFTGEGTLTIISSEVGILCASSQEKNNVFFRSGEISIGNAKQGIYSENSPIIFSGAKVNISASENAVFGKDIKFVSGEITLSEKIQAKGTVTVSNVSLSVSSKSTAIKAEKGISFSDVAISTGYNLSTLNSADSYNGENAIKTVGTKKVTKNGFLFGGKLPAFVDYIVISLLGVCTLTVIIVPIIIKKKKTAKLIAESNAEKAKKNTKKK